MKKMNHNNQKTVLITGASSGIGKALAHEFATNGFDLMLVAQHQEGLDQVQRDLLSKYDIINVWTFTKDLAKDGAAGELYNEIKQVGRTINILVNDAGVGQWGKFIDIPFSKYEEIIHLNTLALTHLTRLFLPEMVARNEGRILQLGSIAGFQPGPLLAVYHATKAFVVSLSEALSTELHDMGSDVTITCLCPGPTDTNFFSRADMEKTRVVDKKEIFMIEPEKVAEGAYKALMDGERIYIPGAMNKVTTFIRRAIPKNLQARMQKQYYELVEE